ncbi:MAG: toll/interleukin-1 receptor domain-containing protein [Candidatus Pedobacter colombiensis]|uniref:Toll/interleukin-1 receptor domain-containing protein n=1 Tax=Candidatus Pedobacter colombiensis TaxID=3121371 RepID=A0AAJ5WD17_9SPHI|nr:toll/interleukin-1 receptor domain-containing protein [Pedobacter sp.]WEK20457.1 MAG: toll/interleukin-1 receptor domain-containing protein [Pedobacter sp.]
MNDFYHISTDEKSLEHPLQMNNLGLRRIMAIIGQFKRNDWDGRSSQSSKHYRDTTPKDYDAQFALRLLKTDPPYEIDILLDHHYNHYVARFDDPKRFLKHVKYVILPLLQNNSKGEVYIELTEDWLIEKEQEMTSVKVIPAKNQENIPAPSDKTVVITNEEVFISYSWDSEEYVQKVVEFTDFLRTKGFHAHLDVMLSQNETSINFVKMMHQSMGNHKKVVVVLSKGYKVKAESFTGGVGEEFVLLLNDIKQSPKKYILISFEGRSDEIIPFGLRGREIIDLSDPKGEEQLYRKLMDEPEYSFSDVASEKPKLAPVKINEFQALVPSKMISIENPLVTPDGSHSQGGLYKHIDFKLILNFKNTSSKTIDGLAYSLRVKQQLAPEYYGQTAEEGYFLFTEDISQKVYPGLTVKSTAYKLKVANHTISQILGTRILITVFTDHGSFSKEFEVEQLIEIKPPNENHLEAIPLTQDLFGY